MPPCWKPAPPKQPPRAGCVFCTCRTAALSPPSTPDWQRRAAPSSPVWMPTTRPIPSGWPCKPPTSGARAHSRFRPAWLLLAVTAPLPTALRISWTGRTACNPPQRSAATASGIRRSATRPPCSGARRLTAGAPMRTGILPKTGNCGCAGCTRARLWKNCRKRFWYGTTPLTAPPGRTGAIRRMPATGCGLCGWPVT